MTKELYELFENLYEDFKKKILEKTGKDINKLPEDKQQMLHDRFLKIMIDGYEMGYKAGLNTRKDQNASSTI